MHRKIKAAPFEPVRNMDVPLEIEVALLRFGAMPESTGRGESV